MVTDAASLAWVVNLGCVDLNPHPVRDDDLDHPDELRIDLDPVPGVPWSQILDVAFVAAGSGITPIMSMIRTVLSTSAQGAVLVYANRDRDSVIFDAELAALQSTHGSRLTIAHWIGAEAGVPTADGLRALLPSPSTGTVAYLCGPAAFMDVATVALGDIGLTREDIHRGLFVSLSTDAFAAAPATVADSLDPDAVSATVEIDGDTHQISWPKSQILLDVLLGLGIDAPYVCREGNCGGCPYTPDAKVR